MSDTMRLSLKDFGPIDTAEIDIGKITVIGGENATGKSTTSKILYCFLRANSKKRQEITYEYIVNLIKDEIRDIQRYLRNQENSKIDFKDLRKKLTQNSNDFNSILEIYDEIKERIDNDNLSDESIDEIDERLSAIDDLIEIVDDNGNPLYVSIMKKLLKAEFSTADFNGVFRINGIYKNKPFDFNIDFENNDLSSDDVFKSEGWFTLNDIYYIDSFSILDLDQNLGLNDSEHAGFLTNNLKKEADESDFWLNLLHDNGYLDETQFASLNNDLTRILKILTSIVKTMRQKVGKE